MSKLTNALLWCGIGVSIWLSDRWSWTLPAVIGVGVGVYVAKAQRRTPHQPAAGVPAFELGSLLILTSFVYLYVIFLVLLFFESDEARPAAAGLLAAAVLLSLLLAGLIASTVFHRRPPAWLSTLWSRLLDERSP